VLFTFLLLPALSYLTLKSRADFLNFGNIIRDSNINIVFKKHICMKYVLLCAIKSRNYHGLKDNSVILLHLIQHILWAILFSRHYLV
jgi:hypothetical protein